MNIRNKELYLFAKKNIKYVYIPFYIISILYLILWMNAEPSTSKAVQIDMVFTIVSITLSVSLARILTFNRFFHNVLMSIILNFILFCILLVFCELALGLFMNPNINIFSDVIITSMLPLPFGLLSLIIFILYLYFKFYKKILKKR